MIRERKWKMENGKYLPNQPNHELPTEGQSTRYDN